MMPALAVAVAAGSPAIVDAAEAGRVAFVGFSEAPGKSALDPALDGLRRALQTPHGIVLVERRECSAPDLDALTCLREADPSVGLVLQLGAGLGDEARVVASLDCARGPDRFARLVGGPFADDAAARTWGETVLTLAVVERLTACASLPAQVTASALPARTVVRLDGRRIATMDREAPLHVVAMAAGTRELAFDQPEYAIDPVTLELRPGDHAQIDVNARRLTRRPRWLFLGVAGASVAAGAALLAVRQSERSGDCVTFGPACDVDVARDARLAGSTDLGVPATMLIGGGVGLAAAELALPRKEAGWWVALIGAAAAGLSALPWLL